MFWVGTAVGCWLLADFGLERLLAASYWPQATGCWLLATGCWLWSLYA